MTSNINTINVVKGHIPNYSIVIFLLTLSYIMLKNGQTYFKNLAVFTVCLAERV